MPIKISLLSSIFFSLSISAGLPAMAAENQGYDLLSQEEISVTSANADQSIAYVLSHLKEVIQRYKPRTDSHSRIVVPPQVSGDMNRPRLQLTLEKCVLMVCKQVLLDADVSLTNAPGGCQKNYVLQADLRRSSSFLTEIYDRLDVQICYSPLSPQTGLIRAIGRAHRSPTYQSGLVQQQIMQTLQLQTPAFVQALQETLQSGSSQPVKVRWKLL